MERERDREEEGGREGEKEGQRKGRGREGGEAGRERAMEGYSFVVNIKSTIPINQSNSCGMWLGDIYL